MDMEIVVNGADTASSREPAAAAYLSLERLIAAHQRSVGRLVQRLLDGHPDAVDITQDVFVVAMEQRGRFRGEAAVETWLCGIAVRLCRRWQRRQTVKRRCLQLLGRQSDHHVASVAGEIDRRDWLRGALSQLRTQDREVLVLRYLELREPSEIAQLLGLRRDAVDQRLSRARQRLALLLEPDREES
jgi:RNA polymerase sigma-70 factor (ECF subfamily)